MSFKFNEVGMFAFFTGAAVTEFVDKQAQLVTEQAVKNASDIMHRYPGGVGEFVGYAMLKDDESSYAKIGVLDPDSGPISKRLDEKEVLEHGWLEPALRLEPLKPR